MVERFIENAFTDLGDRRYQGNGPLINSLGALSFLKYRYNNSRFPRRWEDSCTIGQVEEQAQEIRQGRHQQFSDFIWYTVLSRRLAAL